MPLANRVKELRAAKGLNQQELGALVGASRQTVSLIERGGLQPLRDAGSAHRPGVFGARGRGIHIDRGGNGMNKQAKTPKTSRGVYIKFTLIMIASALTGAFISIFLFGREDGLLQLTLRVSDGLILAGPWLLAAGLVPCAAAHGLYLAGQKAAARADEDDEAFETANRRLSLSMAFSGGGDALDDAHLLPCGARRHPVGKRRSRLAVVPLMIAELAWSYGLQAVVVRAMQRLAPEKRGNVFDLRFQKDWYASCDEAERQRIGECGYHTYLPHDQSLPLHPAGGAAGDHVRRRQRAVGGGAGAGCGSPRPSAIFFGPTSWNTARPKRNKRGGKTNDGMDQNRKTSACHLLCGGLRCALSDGRGDGPGAQHGRQHRGVCQRPDVLPRRRRDAGAARHPPGG